MPVTAKLSRAFYDRLGEQVANELVDWLNAMDATHGSTLRELNELNFARFDAKLEQRVAESAARLDAKIDRVAAELNAKLDVGFALQNERIERGFREQTRWMFLIWGMMFIPIIGLWMRR